MASFTATCHTEGCGNGGVPIEIPLWPETPPGDVYCGACGNPITDKQQNP